MIRITSLPNGAKLERHKFYNCNVLLESCQTKGVKGTSYKGHFKTKEALEAIKHKPAKVVVDEFDDLYFALSYYYYFS